jgi:arylsulfatase A-like enzyme
MGVCGCSDNAYSDGVMPWPPSRCLRAAKASILYRGGFLKPHFPSSRPKKYWDLYTREAIPPAPNPFPPKDATRFTLADWGELRAYDDIPHIGPVTQEQARTLKHGYYACVSYMDAQLGRVLDELERLGLRESTVVVLWGDHGWQLGDHGLWHKHTNFENDTHAPLICCAPGQKKAGGRTRALVEFVDIFPRLWLAGVSRPTHLEGTSFAPLLDAPDKRGSRPLSANIAPAT